MCNDKQRKWILQWNQHTVQVVLLAATNILRLVFSEHWGKWPWKSKEAKVARIYRSKYWIREGNLRTSESLTSSPGLSSTQCILVKKYGELRDMQLLISKTSVKLRKGWGDSQCNSRHLCKTYSYLLFRSGLASSQGYLCPLPGAEHIGICNYNWHFTFMPEIRTQLSSCTGSAFRYWAIYSWEPQFLDAHK
jgi:hypothetical protein